VLEALTTVAESSEAERTVQGAMADLVRTERILDVKTWECLVLTGKCGLGVL